MAYELKQTINENSPRIEQPDKIIIQLKEHQKALIYRARKLEEMKPISINETQQMITQFGVICDHVGAGKSYEVLGTIASAPSLSQKLSVCDLNTKDNYVIFSTLEPTKIDINLIVVPHGVLKQWEDYIVKHTHLTVYVIHNFQKLRNIIKDYKLDELYDQADKIDEPVIDNLLDNQKSYKTNKKVKPVKDTRDTGYYRYLSRYFNNYKEKERLLNQYGSIDTSKLKGFEIMLISATIYNEVAFYFSKDNYFVNRLIFDEADSINIPNNLKINALFYWFVTSSYLSLCNPDGVYKNVVMTKKVNYGGGITQDVEYETVIRENGIKCTGFIKKTFWNVAKDDMRQHYFLKNDDKFIEMSFKLPDIIEHLFVCRDNLQIKVLNGIVSNDVMMMLNAGDTEAAINRLTCEKGSEDNIITVVTQTLEQKILEYKKDLVEKQAKEYSSAKAKQESLEKVQKKIQETREKIKSIEERIKGVECCDICFDDINNPAVTGCCQNVFCFSCLAIAISGKNICPKCRDSLTLDKIMIIKSKEDAAAEEERKKEEEKLKAKPKTAAEFLKEIQEDSHNNDKYGNLDKIIEYKMKYFPKEKRKILIFSEHEGSFNTKMVGVLEKHGIVFSRIKGTSASINKTLREYRGEDANHQIDALLINSRFFGAGLNLQNSSDIIILHRQGADILNQIIGRAQRLGRTDSLHIWKLYHNNEAYNYSS